MDIYITTKRPRQYGVIHFLGDLLGFMVFNVFWLIWIFVRNKRRR
jgi:hypothetical protein